MAESGLVAMAVLAEAERVAKASRDARIHASRDTWITVAHAYGPLEHIDRSSSVVASRHRSSGEPPTLGVDERAQFEADEAAFRRAAEALAKFTGASANEF